MMKSMLICAVGTTGANSQDETPREEPGQGNARIRVAYTDEERREEPGQGNAIIRVAKADAPKEAADLTKETGKTSDLPFQMQSGNTADNCLTWNGLKVCGMATKSLLSLSDVPGSKATSRSGHNGAIGASVSPGGGQRPLVCEKVNDQYVCTFGTSLLLGTNGEDESAERPLSAGSTSLASFLSSEGMNVNAKDQSGEGPLAGTAGLATFLSGGPIVIFNDQPDVAAHNDGGQIEAAGTESNIHTLGPMRPGAGSVNLAGNLAIGGKGGNQKSASGTHWVFSSTDKLSDRHYEDENKEPIFV